MIFDKDHDTAEEGQLQRFLQPSIRLRYNCYVQLVATKRGRMRVANLKSWSARQRGGVKLVVPKAVHRKRRRGEEHENRVYANLYRSEERV